MLQALGGGLISKDMAMRELPFTVNVTQEVEKIEIESMRASLLGSINALSQAIPQMAMQGQDASEVVRQIAAVIKARQKGQALEDVIEEVFTPQPQPVPPAGAPQAVEQPSPVPAGVPAGGATPQIEAAPPDIMSLLSGITGGGKPTASVRSTRRI
jgi:hypothetical protein